MADFEPAVPYFLPLPYRTQDEFLALFDRLLPDFYLAPLKSPGPGYEYLQAVAKLNARISEAVAHMGSGCFIGSATGGTYAQAQVEFYRDNTIFGAVTLKKGTVVSTPDGYLYQTKEDAVFGATDMGPIAVNVQAMVRGWNWNKPGPMVTAAGAVVAGSINRLVSPVVPDTTNNFDPTIQVRQTTDAVGGSSPMLDGLGNDRGIFRTITPAVVELSRATATAGRVVLLAGTRLQTADGYIYRTLSPVTFDAVSTDPTKTVGPQSVQAVPLIQETPTQAYADHGPIVSIELARWGTPATDTFTVTQTRAYNLELDDAYKVRVSILPETVTPSALQKITQATIGTQLAEMGVPWAWREIWDIRYQSAYSENGDMTNGPNDFPINTTLTMAELNADVPDYSSNIFVYDYEPEDPLSNRYIYPETGVIVYALKNDPSLYTLYKGLSDNLEAAKAAGIDLAYVEYE